MTSDGRPAPATDLRAPVLALVAWGAALTVLTMSAAAAAAFLLGLVALVLASRLRGRPVGTRVGWLVAAAAVMAAAGLRSGSVAAIASARYFMLDLSARTNGPYTSSDASSSLPTRGS